MIREKLAKKEITLAHASKLKNNSFQIITDEQIRNDFTTVMSDFELSEDKKTISK